ncbi:hypothetical protein BZM27_31275 [Paraburkholderia steynii]|uniref:Uncharacterized protein n=1 Tax=Paraburkholderia steynii TaxID=1245441 RepID=A0A4R0X6E3_9BURK|nr:hypothetical protein BZM27_31275 [Paraburkholderia steynii]
MDDDQEYYDLQVLDRKARVFPGRERYRETTLPVGDHRDIMSIAYDKLLYIFQYITAHCAAGIDDDVNLSPPSTPLRKSSPRRRLLPLLRQ